METPPLCPECGSVWHDEETCQQHFHQMLAWEHENPANWAVHHLTVLCYHLQHPSLYSPEGLNGAMQLLERFLEQGATPQDVRRQQYAAMNSRNRSWKIKGTPASHGAYRSPVQWTMTAAQVIANGADAYRESVRAWARSVYEALKVSGNLSPA